MIPRPVSSVYHDHRLDGVWICKLKEALQELSWWGFVRLHDRESRHRRKLEAMITGLTKLDL